MSSEAGLPPRISLDARRLALQLGLGTLMEQRACMGYTNGCCCGRCRDRATRFETLTASTVTVNGGPHSLSPATAAKLAKSDSDEFYRRQAHRDFDALAA